MTFCRIKNTNKLVDRIYITSAMTDKVDTNRRRQSNDEKMYATTEQKQKTQAIHTNAECLQQ